MRGEVFSYEKNGFGIIKPLKGRVKLVAFHLSSLSPNNEEEDLIRGKVVEYKDIILIDGVAFANKVRIMPLNLE